jgi:ribose/xylose/arabinose/galactoside ABC-type transport system permease subunit
VLCLFFWAQKHDVFLKPANLADMMRFVATIGLLAIGEILVIITGGIDLSVGSMIVSADWLQAVQGLVVVVPSCSTHCASGGGKQPGTSRHKSSAAF